MNRLYMMLVAMVTVCVAFAQESAFTPVSVNLYQNNMTMVIQLTDGNKVVETAEVAAFVGDECRGAAHATNGLYYLLIVGEGSGQPMELRVCRDGSIYAIDDTQQYVSDGSVGTSWEPYVIDLRGKNPNLLKGDANGDGVVNAADIVAIVNNILGTEQATFIEEAADVNDDGVINAADLVIIVNMIMAN